MADQAYEESAVDETVIYAQTKSDESYEENNNKEMEPDEEAKIEFRIRRGKNRRTKSLSKVSKRFKTIGSPRRLSPNKISLLKSSSKTFELLEVNNIENTSVKQMIGNYKKRQMSLDVRRSMPQNKIAIKSINEIDHIRHKIMRSVRK